MTLKRTLCQVMLFGVAAACVVPAGAALRFTVTADTTNTANPGGTAMSDSHREIEVVLAPTYVASSSGDETTVYDFAQRRRLVLDTRARTVADYSLFDVVGFRELELRNREGLDKALAAIKTGQKLAGLVEHQHELSVQRGAGSPISQRLDGQDKVYFSDDATLLRRSSQSTAVSGADADRFAKFLRYTFGGHPAILADLEKERRIPARLVYTFHPAWGTGTVDVTVSTPREVDAPAVFSLAGYSPKPLDNAGNQLDTLVDRASTAQAPPAADDQRRAREAMLAAFNGRRPFEAFLWMMELQLGGAALPALSAEQKGQLQADPAVRRLSQALAVKDQDGLRQALGTLQWLRTQTQPKRYLLKLFEANDRAMLGDYPAARAMYEDVLQANPALAGAYKDIGDFYFRTFDTAHAWRCWDIGRRLAPQFGNLGAITQFERSLATQFPEYF